MVTLTWASLKKLLEKQNQHYQLLSEVEREKVQIALKAAVEANELTLLFVDSFSATDDPIPDAVKSYIQSLALTVKIVQIHRKAEWWHLQLTDEFKLVSEQLTWALSHKAFSPNFKAVGELQTYLREALKWRWLHWVGMLENESFEAWWSEFEIVTEQVLRKFEVVMAHELQPIITHLEKGRRLFN